MLATDRRSRSELSDEELVLRVQAGDRDSLEVLIARYRYFARAKRKAYFLLGADADDVEQEGLIGLYKAARDYRAERRTCFRSFAELCITRQIISAIKAATRRKARPLNEYSSISMTAAEDERCDRLAGRLGGTARTMDPAEHAVSQERVAEMRRCMAEKLSSLEAGVLRLYVEGHSYREISERLGCHVKSIDNSLQRIKRKLGEEVRMLAADGIRSPCDGWGRSRL